jgi:DNA recombination protein RmuC
MHRLLRAIRNRWHRGIDVVKYCSRTPVTLLTLTLAVLAGALAATVANLLVRRARQRSAAEQGGELREILDPVSRQLSQLEQEIGRLERDRAAGQGELRAMVGALGDGVGRLSEETGRLAGALRQPGARGMWGEMQLRNVVELAGMLEYCDFETQATVNTDDGRLRPDMLVRLPGERLVVVDAKVPLDAFLAAADASDEQERAAHLERHARHLRGHIGRLAAKGYQHQFTAAPEFVVLFIPADAIYQAALAQDPSLIEHGTRERVLVATPTTLIGLLWAINHGWRQERAARSAEQIAELARELHGRLARFALPLARVGRQLDAAVGAYNEAVGSFDARVMPQARRFEQSGAASGRELASPAPAELTARRLANAPARDPRPAPSAPGD